MNSIRKQFILTINSFKDIDFAHPDLALLESMGFNGKGLAVDSAVFDNLCQNTINYCYETIRGSGEMINTNTRNNLSALIGDYLFKILLKNPVGAELIKSIDENEQKNEADKHNLQLILKFGESEDASKLVRCPWEYLHFANDKDPKKGFSLLSKIKLHRVYDKSNAGTGALKKLNVLIFFSPRKGQFKEQQINELQELFRGLKNEYGDSLQGEKLIEGNFSYNFVYPPFDNSDPKATYDNFFTIINQAKPDIVHFIGEAQTRDDNEQLFFWEQNGFETDAKGINLSDSFYGDFQKAVTQSGIKLVVFQTWNNYEDGAYLAFKNIAVKLIDNNLPAVLSIPYSFYRELTNNFDIYKKNITDFYTSMLKEGNSLADAIFTLRNSLSRAGKGYPIVYLGNADIDSFKVLSQAKNEGQAASQTAPDKGPARANPDNSFIRETIVQKTAVYNRTEDSAVTKSLSGTFTKAAGNQDNTDDNIRNATINLSKRETEGLMTRITDIEKKLSLDNGVQLNIDLKKMTEIQVTLLKELGNLRKLSAADFTDTMVSSVAIIDKRISRLLEEMEDQAEEATAADKGEYEETKEMKQFMTNRIERLRVLNRDINNIANG